MLEQCSPDHRQILILKREGMTLDEIAARTGLHEGSIRRILYELAKRLALPRRIASDTRSSRERED
jgi:RNA polymerase sigma-70 factor (ECF subfamily)